MITVSEKTYRGYIKLVFIHFQRNHMLVKNVDNNMKKRIEKKVKRLKVSNKLKFTVNKNFKMELWEVIEI
jgi:hypothetical protein